MGLSGTCWFWRWRPVTQWRSLGRNRLDQLRSWLDLMVGDFRWYSMDPMWGVKKLESRLPAIQIHFVLLLSSDLATSIMAMERLELIQPNALINPL